MSALECSYDGTLNNFLIAPVRIDGLRSIRTQLQDSVPKHGIVQFLLLHLKIMNEMESYAASFGIF